MYFFDFSFEKNFFSIEKVNSNRENIKEPKMNESKKIDDNRISIKIQNND